ncbi:MAG: class A beta-lactamase-related serine hydrolase [Gammaproteobacteria bacterium]|nr:class A beta-lactamase-related serine hydrolase [Gammaproteobacteria bacterium]
MPALHTVLDALLSNTVAAGTIPNVVAIVGNRAGAIYESAFGSRVLGEQAAMTPDSVIWIASMTKAVTATAAMQLVEQGKLALDAPAHTVVPELANTKVLEGFDTAGKPRLRAPRRPITLRHLLTHTAGFGYEFMNADIKRYVEVTATPSIMSCENAALTTPLLFDPGEAWEYGINIDWAGKMVERISGMPIGRYFQEQLFSPLKMTSTSFKLSTDQRRRLVGMHARGPDGKVAPFPLEVQQEPEFEMSGGALYSTVHDYLRFMRMIMGEGSLDGVQVLRPETVAEMARNQIGDLHCGRTQTVAPEVTNAADFFPGAPQGWGLSFVINKTAVPGGRAAGSLAWAGLSNAYYWIDLKNGICAVLATQLFPFFDTATIGLLGEFETAIYANLQ